MMKKLSILPLLFMGVSVFAQMDDASKYAGIIRTSELQKHLNVIASDAMEGRETGTEGQRKAAAYIESFFKTTGLAAPAPLKGQYQQLYPLYKDSMVSSTLKIGKTEAVYGTDYISPVNNNETAKAKGKSIVFAGYGIVDKNYSDYEGLDVKGKTVVIFLGEPKKDGKYFMGGTARGSEWSFPGLVKKLDLAMAKGAKSVLVINPNAESFNARAAEASKKTNVYYPRNTVSKKKLNYAQLSHAYAKSILGEKMSAAITKAKSNSLFDASDRFDQKIKTSFDFK